MSEPTAILDELKYIENKVCKILGKTPMQPMNNAEIAKFNLKNVTQINDLHEKDNCIDISNNSNENNSNKTTQYGTDNEKLPLPFAQPRRAFPGRDEDHPNWYHPE